MIDKLWGYWQACQARKLPIVGFVKARLKDMNDWRVGFEEREPHACKRKEYIEVDDNEVGESIILVDKGT